jgi:hypothetical protein
VTKHPIDSPKAFAHFHNSMGRDAASDPQYMFLSDLTVAHDKVLINLPRGRNDVWIAHLK